MPWSSIRLVEFRKGLIAHRVPSDEVRARIETPDNYSNIGHCEQHVLPPCSIIRIMLKVSYSALITSHCALTKAKERMAKGSHGLPGS